jgi:ankyrin repeat protein
MTVPGRIDEDEEENALFQEEGVHIQPDSDTPPHLRELAAAAELGDVNALRLAIDHLNGSLDEPVEDGDTALHLTCLYGFLECVQLLVERGASLDVMDEDGAIPLHDACAGGFVEIVQFLITSADNPNHPHRVKRMLEMIDIEGDTPLHHAARGEHANVVRALLAAGASPAKRNSYGKV